MKKRVIIFSLLMGCALMARAQFGRLYLGDQYLLSSMTLKIMQDKYGRIWIGTRNGINIFDGYAFREMKMEDSNNLGLDNNYITELYQDRAGRIYIGNNEGVQVFAGDRCRDVTLVDTLGRPVKGYVENFLQTSQGEMLIAISGRGVFEMKNDSVAQMWPRKTLASTSVMELFEDNQHRLWILTQGQGVKVRQNGKWYTCQTTDGRSGFFMSMCQGDDGTFYLANIQGGLYRSMPGQELLLDCIEATQGLKLQTVTRTKEGDILLGSDGLGVFRYLPESQSVTRIGLYSKDFDINRAKVNGILEDSEGNLWVSIFQKGIYMLPNRQFDFTYIGHKSQNANVIGEACVMTTRYGKDGTLWVATDRNGLYALSPTGELIRHYAPGNSANAIPSTILGISEDAQGRIWVGAFLQGAGWIDRQSGAFHRLECTHGRADNVFDVYVDKRQQLWIGTMGDGLKRIDLATGKLTEYREGPKDQNCIGNNYINQLVPSRDGDRLYVCSCEGVYALDIPTGQWVRFKGEKALLRSSAIYDVAEDAHDGLWIGCNKGICRYDMRKHTMKWYTIEEKLSNNNVSAIRVDKHGRVWISTYNGLNCLIPETGEIRNFYVSDGLQSNEFSEGASCANPQGQMVFGGVAGISVFHPDEITPRKRVLRVQVTDFRVGNNMVTAGSKSGRYTITDSTAIASHNFQLSHDDNSFSIALSTLSFANTERITYAYQVNNEEWVTLQSGVNEMTFTHMPAGTYHFRVQAIDGDLKSAIREFTVVIHPAWYMSGWAMFVYVLLFIGAIVWIFMTQRHRAQARLRMQEHIHSEELSEAKVKFFINYSHEIRTPMTLIISPLQQLIQSDHDPHRLAVYEVIKRNAERILHLINQMMDLRKIEKGQMVLRMQETDLIGFVNDVYTLFQLQAQAKHIQLRFEHQCEHLPIWIDLDNFDKVVVNLLSNAFKFTPQGGEVVISVTKDEHMAHIAIKDNGEAIPADKLDKIFERFYQSTSSINNRKMGTGIGLDLTRSLVELHHGNIIARNNEGERGCEFVVSVPLGNAHLKPDEMITPEEREAYRDKAMAEIMGGQDTTEEEPQAEPAPQTSTRKPSVVIVEDDDETRTYLKTELGRHYMIEEYDNGADAWKGILLKVPDLVISDVVMPKMDGNTLCLKLKANVNTNHVPLILLTARGQEENRLEGLETGADAYIVKPFNMDILRRTVINLLNARNVMRNKYSGQEEQKGKVEDVEMKSPDERLLENVMAVINHNLDNVELNVDMIAEEVGISRGHLHRQMKKLTNQTPHDFIRNIRLKQAANLLATQNHNITEVMYACGFSNAASFSTMFKNFYGMSPREYMREHAKR